MHYKHQQSNHLSRNTLVRNTMELWVFNNVSIILWSESPW